MIIVLAIILIVLLLVIGGERGAAAILSLIWNVFILSLSIVLMGWGWNSIFVTFVSSILISSSTLFYQNGKNAKTIASFWAVMIVMLLLFFIAYQIGFDAKLRGLNEIIQKESDLLGFSVDIHINMARIAVTMIMLGLIGAAIDTSIAISSAIYEVFKNNRYLCFKELFASGIRIGKDILGTMVNTLYFAYLGESISLFILFKQFHYSFTEVINSKAFFQEFVCIIFSGISCVLVIPITALIISYILTNPDKLKKQLEEDALFLSDTDSL